MPSEFWAHMGTVSIFATKLAGIWRIDSTEYRCFYWVLNNPNSSLMYSLEFRFTIRLTTQSKRIMLKALSVAMLQSLMNNYFLYVVLLLTCFNWVFYLSCVWVLFNHFYKQEKNIDMMLIRRYRYSYCLLIKIYV